MNNGTAFAPRIARDAPHGSPSLRHLARLLANPIVSAACAPRSAEDYLQLFSPAWSLSKVRAQIVALHPENPRALSVWLRPNGVWRGYRAGQYVRLTVRVRGRLESRCFSLSSAPHEPLLRLTVRRHAGGVVSGWLADCAERGDYVELSQALGDFVVPAEPPPRLLLISGGSGVTPIRSIMQQLHMDGYRGELLSLHFTRDSGLLEAELLQLARRNPYMRVATITTAHPPGTTTRGARLSQGLLDRLFPSWRESEVFVCGPLALEQAARRILADAGREQQLHVERFASPALLRGESLASGRGRHVIHFQKSGRQVMSEPGLSLLQQAELLGLSPAHGCRMGICHLCKCKKNDGTVRNLLTGAESGPGEEDVQLCVSVPSGPVTIDL